MNENNLLIIGAGGHGRCCADIAKAMNQFDKIGFLDDVAVDTIVNDLHVIGKADELASHYGEYKNIVVAIGNNSVRRKLMKQCEDIGYKLVNLIHPFASVSSYATLGKGNVIFPYATIEANATIKNGCILCSGSVMNHDAYLESYCLVYSNTTIRPNTYIGKETRIGSNCCVCVNVTIKDCSDIADGMIIRENI